MNAMGAILDEGIANVINALRRTGLYKDTLLVVASDNGGWIQNNYGGNNYPLRGGKVTDFEGGVRTVAFVAGGYLKQKAPNLIGSRSDLLIHLVDWYATLVGLSSATRSDDKLANQSVHNSDIPPVDSLDVWEALIRGKGTTAIRQEIPLSFCNEEAACDWPGE